MATKVANSSGPLPQTPHTSGLYADMTLDGPEIGTLVIVFDRAKNLPNRKTMGKQNPYCAARLGKEAKKTDTDRRGGQTPRWDQELRFIVHESPDYHKVKISVFSEDKRTDLIGEAWVDLTQVIVPGGGKSDLWQNLTFKGKYAGELRMELTYYDERPKPVEVVDSMLSMAGDPSRVKRRPLPTNPNNRHVTPDTIPGPAIPGRAKHGPRDLSIPPRPNSMPAEVNVPQPYPGYAAPAPQHGHPYSSPVSHAYQTSSNHYDMAPIQYEEPQTFGDGPYNQPEFLPQLPPSNRQRNSLPMPSRMDPRQSQIQLRAVDHIGLHHSHSSPSVPMTHMEPENWDDAHQLRTDLPEPIPDVEYQYQHLQARSRSSEALSGWQTGHHNPHANTQPYVEEDNHAPPPPPVHSNSSPAVPQRSAGHPVSSPMSPYGSVPPGVRYESIPNSSQLQGSEWKYGTPPRQSVQGSPANGMALDPHTPSPEQRVYNSSPSAYAPGQIPSAYARQQPPPRPTPTRHSISDLYNTSTPPRPHPLSQELSQMHSPPQHLGPSPQVGNHPYPTQYRNREGLPLIKPRPVSPQAAPQPPLQPNSAPPRSKSAYDIQFPVRSFESSDNSPLSTAQPNPRVARLSNPITPARKSLSPQSSPPHTASSIPYSPDSFNIHNPNAQSATIPNGNSPHSPYQIRPGSEALPRYNLTGPIVDSHGNEVDPSDRLPMNSWAPEPEKKTPTRTYGLGRDRDFGPRSPLGGPESTGGSGVPGKNLSKDTVVNFRSRNQPQPSPGEPAPMPGRNRLQKRSPQPAKSPTSMMQPLQERHNFNNNSAPAPPASFQVYEQQQQEYGSRDGFYNNQLYEQPGSYYSGSYAAMSEDALAREISNIDIGGGNHRYPRSGSVPAPTAYVPVRSHRDRKTLF